MKEKPSHLSRFNPNAKEIRTTFEQMKSMRQEVTKMAAGTVKNIRKVTLVCTRSYLRVMMKIMAGMIFVKKITQPLFWEQECYAKNT